MTEQARVCAGTVVGAFVGAAMAYLFYTDRGRGLRDSFEPTVDDLMRDFQRFRRTIENVGEMANDGMRAFQEFQTARTPYPDRGLSH